MSLQEHSSFKLYDYQGIMHEDYFQLIPLSGKKKRVKLNRTRFDFISENFPFYEEGNISQDGYHFYPLPSLKDEAFHYVLTLDPRRGFRLKSVMGSPFRLNGNFVFESFVEAYDVCELGLNRLQFLPKKFFEDEESSFHHFDQLAKENQGPLSLLIEGETGTGKSHLAKKVHEHSELIGPFVHINLSAFSENLLESELFGHVRGAFTGAINDKRGAFRLANGGTLFLDEIDSLSKEMQVKLLLFLDNKEVIPVGGAKAYKVEARLIFASGRKLEHCVEKGDMRRDFYFRVTSGKSLRLKNLRDEPARIRLLCEEFALQNGVNMSKSLLEFYQELPWPGNIRQLLGFLEKKKSLQRTNKWLMGDLEDELLVSSSALEMLEDQVQEITLKEMKKKYSLKVYYQSHKNLELAAKKLDISKKSLRNYLAS